MTITDTDQRIAGLSDETAERIAQDVLAAGLRRGGSVLVHSSLSSLGRVPGGAETVIRGLISAIGPQGTLLMPALSYEHANPWSPFFDARATPSNVGLIPETFRTRAGTLRSINPTHSVCAGPLAAQLLGEHRLDDTPCGPHSPFRKLRDYDGQILFIGCGLRPNTSMHSVEELVVPPYLFGPMITYQVVLPDGEHISLPCRSHDFAGWRQRYDRIEPLLYEQGLHTGMVLAAWVHVVDCKPMWDQALAAYGRDPLYFVEGI